MKDYLDYDMTGNLAEDVKGYFEKFDCIDIYEHQWRLSIHSYIANQGAIKDSGINVLRKILVK